MKRGFFRRDLPGIPPQGGTAGDVASDANNFVHRHSGIGVDRSARPTGKTEPHRLLRIPSCETDPVMIILAAQIQLRRWRRMETAKSPAIARRRIRDIVAARDSLMERAVSRTSGTALSASQWYEASQSAAVG